MSDNVASVDLLVRELCELAEWYTLGAYLGLTENEIREIEQDHHETARRRLAMLSKWVKKEANPSWAKIVSALERMSEMSLANQLREKYIRIRSNQVQPAAATASGMEPAALIVASADTAGEQSMTIMKVDRKELVVRKLEEVEEKYLELIVVTESALESIEIRFEQSLYTVAESGGSRIVTVELDKPSAVPIPLQYSTVDDTATGKYCTISLVTTLSH